MSYIQPGLSVVIVLLLIGAVGPARRRKRMPLLAAGGLFVWSWFPVTVLTSATLERRYPEAAIPRQDAEAFVVLPAGVTTRAPTQPAPGLDFSSYLRVRYAAWLYRNWKPLPVLASGGTAGPSARPVAVSEVMKEALLANGVPPEMIWTETRSSSTYENAVYSARVLREKGIRRVALVTEGYHMPRAEGAFRKQGLEVVPAPCCFRSTWGPMTWRTWLPSADAILRNEDCLHEWVGLLWYWVSGKI